MLIGIGIGALGGALFTWVIVGLAEELGHSLKQVARGAAGGAILGLTIASFSRLGEMVVSGEWDWIGFVHAIIVYTTSGSFLGGIWGTIFGKWSVWFTNQH